MKGTIWKTGVIAGVGLLAAGNAFGASDGCGLTASNGTTLSGAALWSDIQTTNTQYHSPCDIAQFSWNNFLYLMQSDSAGHPRFMSFAPWYDVVPASGAPVWRGAYNPLSTVQLNKVDNQGQAGDGFHLLDVAGTTTAYDMRVNQVFVDYVSKYGLYTQAALNSAASAFTANQNQGGIWLPPNNMETGSTIEVKTAWRNFGSGNLCPSDIMHCETEQGGNQWGLVGLHLVQKTQIHGEAIWATFEHVANAPDCSPGGNNPIKLTAVNPRSNLPPVNVNSRIPALAAKTGWSYFNYADYVAQGGDGKVCSYPDGSSPPTKQCLNNPNPSGDKTSWQQTNVCRTALLPIATSTVCSQTSDPAAMVACLNKSVAQQFPKGFDNKWKYYMLVGNQYTRWGSTGPGGPRRGCWEFQQGAGPTVTRPQPVQTENLLTLYGDQHLANTTMETWMQKSISLKTATGTISATNCFSCHQPTTTIWGQGDMSHLFDRITQPGAPGKDN